jgi:hypothetical protein
MVKRLTFLLIALWAMLLPAHATDYHVGPGQAVTSLLAVNWNALQPGDRVLLHWRPTPYAEKVIISSDGVTLEGVPDVATGALPIISGASATSRPDMDVPGGITYLVETFSPVIVSRRAAQAWTYAPSNVTIRKVRIQNVDSAYSFTNSAGGVQAYTEGCGIWINGGKNILVEGCEFDDVNNGVFNKPVVYSLTIRGCKFTKYGKAGSFKMHGTYTEGIGVVIEGCYFGASRAGGGGAVIKDRSAGFIARYNELDPGKNLTSSRFFDLVDPQDGAPAIRNGAGFGTSTLIGNVLWCPLSGDYIHAGGDSQNPVVGSVDYLQKVILQGNKIVIVGSGTYLRGYLVKFDAQFAPTPNPNNVPTPPNSSAVWDNNDVYQVGSLGGGLIALSNGPGSQSAPTVNRLPAGYQGAMGGVAPVVQTGAAPTPTMSPTIPTTTTTPTPTTTTTTDQLATVTAERDALKVQVASLQGQVTALQGQVTTLQGQITVQQTQITALQATVTSLQAQLKASQDAAAAAVTQLQAIIKALGG